MSKAAGDKWKAMSDVQKKPFNDKAAALKKEFEQAMEKFTASGGVAGKRRADKKAAQVEKAGKKAKSTKDPNKPKRAPTAYWLWLQENRDS